MASFRIAAVKQYLKGFFLHGVVAGINAEKRQLDELVMLALFGPAIGIPGLFNYYHLRLLPYYAGKLPSWKRRVLRERDFFDQIGD